MSYPFSAAIIEAENDVVRELIEKADDAIDSAVDAIQEACGTGGDLCGHDAFVLTGQILKLKQIRVEVDKVLSGLKPEKRSPTLDEEGEVMTF